MNKKYLIIASLIILSSSASVASANWFTELFGQKDLGASILTVKQGGTGATSFGVGECLFGNGTGAVTSGSCAAVSMTALPATQTYVGNATNQATATSSINVSTAGNVFIPKKLGIGTSTASTDYSLNVDSGRIWSDDGIVLNNNSRIYSEASDGLTIQPIMGLDGSNVLWINADTFKFVDTINSFPFMTITSQGEDQGANFSINNGAMTISNTGAIVAPSFTGSVTGTASGNDILGQATSTLNSHTSIYNHGNYDTAYANSWSKSGSNLYHTGTVGVGTSTLKAGYALNVDGGKIWADDGIQIPNNRFIYFNTADGNSIPIIGLNNLDVLYITSNTFKLVDTINARPFIEVTAAGEEMDANIEFNNGKVFFDYAGNVGIGTTSPGQELTISGDLLLTGGIYAQSSLGTNGMVLQTTGSGIQWVATSTLGLGGGGGSGTVTSVDMTVPTGLSVSGNPITTSGTLALSLTGGYVIPLTASTTNWNTAYNWGNHAGLYDVYGQATSTLNSHTTTYNHANYDTAYGWGNHASVGYFELSSWYATTSAPQLTNVGLLANASTTLLSVSGQSWFTGLLNAVNATLTGLLTTAQATITSVLKIPNSTGLTVSNTGDVGIDTQYNTFKYNSGGNQYVLNSEKCSAPAFTIENPTTSESIAVMIFNATSTITKVRAVNKTLGDTCTFNLNYRSARNAAGTNVFSSGQAITSTTTPKILTTFSNATPNANDLLIFTTSAASSTEFMFDVCWREN